MTIGVQVGNSESGLTGLEFICLGSDTQTWWHMEAISHVPVDLILGIVNPEPFDKVLGSLNILAFGCYHFGPATQDGCLFALCANSRERNNARVIAQGLYDTRHSPQAAPLHGTQALREGGRVPPVGRCIFQNVPIGI